MASEKERQKNLRALVRRIIKSNLSIKMSDAEKIVRIGKECVPFILEFVRDEKGWDQITYGEIYPLTAIALLGSIGSADALEDVFSAILKHDDDLDLIDYLIPSILASCARGRSDFLLKNAFDSSLDFVGRLTCLDALGALGEIEPESREAIGGKLAGYLSSSEEPEFNGYLISTLIDVDQDRHLREIEDAFSRKQVDEKVIDMKLVMKLVGPEKEEDLLRTCYLPPLSFFEAENMESIRSEMDEHLEDDDEDDEDFSDEEPSTIQELADLIMKRADEMYRKTGRNDPCICGSGEKFKNCCLPNILERKRISPLEDRLRGIIQEFNDSDAGGKLLREGSKTFNFGERIVMEQEMQLLMDWYCHDYIQNGGKTTIDLVIEISGANWMRSRSPRSGRGSRPFLIFMRSSRSGREPDTSWRTCFLNRAEDSSFRKSPHHSSLKDTS